MCGICGIYNYQPSSDREDSLRIMLDAIRHRGTIDGRWSGANISLGSRRLPIIDIEHSPQPIFNEDRSIVLVGNGEIYNFRDLNSELEARGHSIGTQGDLECIVHLYEEHDENFWSRLRGMFAVALYDIKKDTLILSRDHLGIKPLFYRKTGSSFQFSSEIKSFTGLPDFHAGINPQAVSDFLCLQFVPKPQTIYPDIFSLPPASFLVLKNGSIEIKTFWNLQVASSGSVFNAEDLVLRSRSLLEQAVDRWLITDVPLGVLLSGGLDSSALAALTTQRSNIPVKTFAIVFKEESFDESRYSRQMAGFLKSDHHEVILDEDMILDSLEQISYFFDEPFCEGSAMPIYHICKYAKEYVTVILSGEGADEIYCGYETYTARNLSKYYTKLPLPLQQVIRSIVQKMPVSDNKVSLDMKLKRFTDGVRFSPPKAHFWWRAAMNDNEKLMALNQDFISKIKRPHSADLYTSVYDSFETDDIINRLMATDCSLHLPDDLLLRADRMSMAHTMELRVPYLDIDLVEFAFSVPSAYKISGGYNKILLRNAMKGLIPEVIRKRTKKGLNMPYQRWFKRRRWKDLLFDTLSRNTIEPFGIFDYQGIQSLLSEHLQGKKNNAHGLWTLINLVLWLQKHRV